MEYTSFYGGRRGSSFVIVKSYQNIAEMVAAFSQGGAYEAVGYDEYVIIDTIDKNDIDNGKIYRRGYDYSNEIGGAIYIGQIVGPDGAAPHVEMKTYKEVEDLYADHGPVDPATGDEYRKSEGEYAPTDNLIPGAYDEGGELKYNDSIKWITCSIRDEHSNSSTVHVGFIIPYTVIDYTAKSVDPYYHRTNETEDFDNDNLIEREDDKKHPYYEKWHLNIPKGIKGDTFQKLRVIPADETIEDYQGKDDDIAKGRKVVVYDYLHYDKEENGEPVTIYLGDYNKIDNVTLDEEGTITFDYSHDDDKVFEKAIKWIKEVTLNSETGHLTVKYNYDEKDGKPTIYETDLRWVNKIEVAEDGTVTLKYTTGQDVVLDNKIKWVKQTTLDPDGTLTFTYNDDSTDTFNKQIQWIRNITFEDNGHLTIEYNNDTPVLEKDILWLTDVKVNTGETEGAGSQKVEVVFNNGTSKEIGMPLNYVMQIAVDSRYHLLALYSDPARREANGIAGRNVSWQNRDDWCDLGYIGNGSGVGAIAGKESDEAASALAKTLPPYSAWFIIEEE